MRIAVIGAGITGLTAALELSKQRHKVELFEAAGEIGGIAGTFAVGGVAIEKYYHHFFKSDRHLVALLEELGLHGRIRWLESGMGFFSDGRSYAFGTPASLLRFEPLGLPDKLKFGLSMLRLMNLADWTKLENVTAEAWLKKHAGEKACEKIWRPLLAAKFGPCRHDISMAWMWGKIKLRGTSKEAGKEVLGYIQGSTKVLLDGMQGLLAERQAQIRTNCEVKSVVKTHNGFEVQTACGGYHFDAVLNTAPLPRFLEIGRDCLPREYREKMEKIRYTSVLCSVLVIKKSFSPFYWLNIGDESIPFGGLIQHTNLLDKRLYNGKHILYISNYLFRSSPYYGMSGDALMEAYMPHLKRINPEFGKEDIEEYHTFKDAYAQPVITCGYSAVRPGFETPVENLYSACMCNIYPEDRGMNYAVRDGKAVAELIGNQPVKREVVSLMDF